MDTIVNTVKGQKVDLTKTNPGLNMLKVGLGWDVGNNHDLDAFALMLRGGKVTSAEDVIYFNNLKSKCGSVSHSGDNLTGHGEGDDEVITIDLAKVPADVDSIAIAMNIYEANNRKQNMGQVKNAFVRVVNANGDTEIVRYDLSEDFSIDTGVVMGTIYRKDGEWKFEATGKAFSGDLNQFVAMYK